MTTKAKRTQRDEAIEILRPLVKPGDKVWTFSHHHNRVEVSVLLGTADGIRNVTYLVAQVLGERRLRSGGIAMLEFDVVYGISYALFPGGFDIPAGERGRNGSTGHDVDGGYALTMVSL